MGDKELIEAINKLYSDHNGTNMGQVDYELFAYELADLVIEYKEKQEGLRDG